MPREELMTELAKRTNFTRRVTAKRLHKQPTGTTSSVVTSEVKPSAFVKALVDKCGFIRQFFAWQKNWRGKIFSSPSCRGLLSHRSE